MDRTRSSGATAGESNDDGTNDAKKSRLSLSPVLITQFRTDNPMESLYPNGG